MKPQETVKDRARQAYLDQQTQDSEGGCGQPVGFIYGFIAGEESAQSRIKELEKLVSDSRIKGIELCINKLRALQANSWHQSKWNHSRELQFAPVELSDYLVINVLRPEIASKKGII